MWRYSLLALLLALPACPETRVEVSTEVLPGGAATRTLRVVTEDHGKPAPLPEELLPPPAGYTVLRQTTGLLEATGSFADVGKAPAAFALAAEGMSRRATSRTRYRSEDWLLFTRHLYQETVRDVVDPDGIREALDEAADLLVSLLLDSFRSMFGEDFDQTVLESRLRGDLRRMLREAALLGWQLSTMEGDRALEVLPARVVRLARRHGLDVEEPDVVAAVDDWESPAAERIRRALASWLQAGLVPRQEGGRAPVVPDLETVLFQGPFTEVFERAVRERFGSQAAADRWWEELQARVFGLFGRDRKMSFRVRVRMPGILLRSNGFLGNGGWTFVEFPAKAAYPNGAGVACESVEWNAAAMGALPLAGFVTDNETALSWMWVLGEGPAKGPSASRVVLLRRCLAARSLAPLEEEIRRLEEEEPEAEALARLEALHDWIRGGRE